jgi:glycosyltransferase involved in cell wall biosynthesis
VSNRKIRILHVIDSDFVGGAQDTIWGIAKYRNTDRLQFDMCFLQSHGEKYRSRFGGIFDNVSFRCSSTPGVARLALPPVQKVPYDIVHSHLFVSFLWTSAWLPFLGKHIVHSINHTEDQVPFYCFPMYRQFARKRAFYFALNKTIKRDLISHRIRPEKISLQPIGIDTARFLAPDLGIDVREKYHIDAAGPLLLRVARLEKDKKHELFIQAMPDILKTVPDAKLVIAGEGSQRGMLEDLAQRLGVAGSVVFCGECGQDLPALNRICKVAVSLGFGSASTENMLCGLPVVSFNEVGAEELITHGENGFIAPANDITAFAGFALDLLTNDQKRKAMGVRAEARVKSTYAFDRIAASYEAFYETLMRDDGATS